VSIIKGQSSKLLHGGIVSRGCLVNRADFVSVEAFRQGAAHMCAHLQMERSRLEAITRALTKQLRVINERCESIEREIQGIRDVVSTEIQFPQTGQADTKAQACESKQGKGKRQ
jgi:hypothetical protein